MIRQAHTYMVGAVSGATLIALAIAVFVLLVSAQVFRGWPIAALGDSGGGSVGVSDARPAGSGATGGLSGVGATAKPAASTGGGADGRVGAGKAAGAGSLDGTGATRAGQTPSATGDTDSGGGSPITSSPSPRAPSSDPSSGSGGGGGSNGSENSGSAATTPSGQVSKTVNNTVDTVDETVTGGALEKTGVTGVTEGVVNGVVGPEPTVGKVVDETVGAVEGLLHPHH